MKIIRKNNLKNYIDDFLEIFPKMTKEEIDFIKEILMWDKEKKSAYLFAKQIFEDPKK